MTEKKQNGGQNKFVFTEDEIIQLESLGAVLSKVHIAHYFGITHNTLNAAFERQPDALARYKKGKAKAIATVAGGLLRDAIDGDPAQRMFYLKTQAGWNERSSVEISNPDGSMAAPVHTIRLIGKADKNDKDE